MGGKTSTTTSGVSVPASVLAQYQSVVASANQTAQQSFQDYSGQFVAPVNAEQTAGIAGTNVAANEAQPYYDAATGVLGNTQASTTPVNTAAEIGTAESAAPLTGSQINQYLSPYLGDVLSSTEAIQNQENQQQQAGQLGDAITSGAFGSDRTGIAAANLEEQQNLANANIISGIANTGYQSALSTAQGEQQIGLAGANQLASIGQTAYGEGANTASELGELGTGAESAGLAGAQAQIQAGTVQQQTQQAQDTALYNQFLQEQSYPFQVGQWLADISEGTGSLSGSTTTTTQPGGFFSDKRLKRDIKKIGETFDGQDVVTYKMGDDERTRIGLIAQDVEEKHPEAVGLAGGFKIVDYGKATKEAANKGRFYAGGLVRSRDAGSERTDAYRARGGLAGNEPRRHYAVGGVSGGLDGVLQAQQQMYSGLGGSGQLRSIPSQSSGSRGLAVANAPASPPPSGASEVNQTMGLANNAYKLYQRFTAPSPSSAPTGVVPASAAESTASELGSEAAPAIAADTSSALAPAVGAAPTATELSANAGALAPLATSAAPAAAASAAPAAAAADAGAAAAAAAAPAAASAAAPAAASALGSAAAGVGADAAAEAAAALAAEYAAADAGAAALIFARGGRARFDAGGMPYSGAAGLAGPYASPDGDINIPDEPNTNTLKAAPAAGKQPTGFQSMLYMGDPDNWDSLMGSSFSNQALERGGVAGHRSAVSRATGGLAGRRGFADGGDPTDDDSSTPATASDADSAQSAPSGGGGGLAGWWGRNKGTLLPILAGIGAAGTARTVHPGVALAAGLEAAANDYVPTQEGLAKAQETQALAESQQLQNVPLAVKARIAQTVPIPGQTPSGGLAPPPQTVNPAPATIASAPTASPAPTVAPLKSVMPPTAQEPSASAASTAAGIDAEDRARFFVNKAPTPEEQQNLQDAAVQDWAVGGTMNTQRATLAYHARVQRDLQNSQNTAQGLADAAYAQATDPTASPAARQAALVRYNSLRQWTGDGAELDGGIMRNARTKQPEIGTIAQQGLTPAEAASIQIQESQPVDTGAPARTPLSTWAAQHGITLPSTAVGAPGPIGATGVPSQGAATAPIANTRRAPRAESVKPLAQPPGRGNAPDFSSAPAAPAWAHDPSVVVPAGQDPKAYADTENDLIAESGRLQETQSDIIKTQRMLNLLPSAKTGPGSDTMAMAQTALGNLTGSQFVSWLNSNPSAYAILQKSLGQQALESRLQEMREGGASVRLGAMQDNLILNKLSASPEMPKSAIYGILNWQLQQDNWDLRRETAIPQYLSQGRDARYFNNIYPKQNPLSQSLTVGAPPGTTVSHGAPGPVETVTSQAEYDALPKGASYLWNGQTRVKQ